MVFLACVHLALFLALSLSPGNSLVSSWCDRSTLAASFRALTVARYAFLLVFSIVTLGLGGAVVAL